MNSPSSLTKSGLLSAESAARTACCMSASRSSSIVSDASGKPSASISSSSSLSYLRSRAAAIGAHVRRTYPQNIWSIFSMSAFEPQSEAPVLPFIMSRHAFERNHASSALACCSSRSTDDRLVSSIGAFMHATQPLGRSATPSRASPARRLARTFSSIASENWSHMEKMPSVDSSSSRAWTSLPRTASVLGGCVARTTARKSACDLCRLMKLLRSSSVCSGRSSGSPSRRAETRPGRSTRSRLGTSGDETERMSMCVCEMPVTTPDSARIASSIASRTSIFPESVTVRGVPSILSVSRLKRASVGGAGLGLRRSWILIGMRVHRPSARGKMGSIVMRSRMDDLPHDSAPSTTNIGVFHASVVSASMPCSRSSTPKTCARRSMRAMPIGSETPTP